MGGVIPGCMLVYGWSIEKAVGGVPVPVIAMFLQGIAQLFCFPSLNTYCLDVMQSRSAEVVAGDYMLWHFFAALATAVVLPAIDVAGIGWFSTIVLLFLVASTVFGVGYYDMGERLERELMKAGSRKGVLRILRRLSPAKMNRWDLRSAPMTKPAR